MLLSKSVEVKRSIVQPMNAVFQSNGESEIIEPVSELSSLQTLRLGAFGGIGFTQSVGNSISIFTEVTYTHLFGNIVIDGDWNVSRLNLHVGAKLRW